MSSDSMSTPRRRRLGASRRRARGRLDRVLARPELLGLLGLAGVLNLWGLSINGWANQYYSAAVRSMSTSWHDFLFASLDPSGLMTVDKPPLALWVQALSARVFGFHPLSLLVPQALMGVGAVGAHSTTSCAGASAASPDSSPGSRSRPRRSSSPSRATTTPTSCSCCARSRRCGSRCARSRRADPVARAQRRRRRARLRDEDGRRADGRAGDRGGVDVGCAARGALVALSPAARRRRGDGRRRRCVAAARDADAGRRPAVDLGHVRQQHLVADLRLQRARPGRGPDRRPRRWRGWRAEDDVRRPDRGASACSSRRSATRPGGCSASPWSLAVGCSSCSAAAPRRSAHRLADRRRRRVPDDGRRLQLRERHLPSLLRLAAGAVHGGAHRRRRRGRCSRAGVRRG